MKTKREAARAEARAKLQRERFIAFARRGGRKWFLLAHESKDHLIGYAKTYAAGFTKQAPVTVHVAEIQETFITGEP